MQEYFCAKKRQLNATYANEKIIIDGMDNELSLSKTQVTSDEFYQLIPPREVAKYFSFTFSQLITLKKAST